VRTGDLLKESPQFAPLRPAVGMSPQLSDAELVTLAVLQALLGFTSEARWVRHARAHLRHLFPYLPQQPGYNKRLRAARGLVRPCARVLVASHAPDPRSADGSHHGPVQVILDFFSERTGGGS
jgi:hypothetical protein